MKCLPWDERTRDLKGREQPKTLSSVLETVSTYLLAALQQIDRSDRTVGKTTGEDTSQTAVSVVFGGVEFELLLLGHAMSKNAKRVSPGALPSLSLSS